MPTKLQVKLKVKPKSNTSNNLDDSNDIQVGNKTPLKDIKQDDIQVGNTTVNDNTVNDNTVNDSELQKTKSSKNKRATNITDKYTKECLIEQFNIHKQYILARINASKKCGVSFRLPSIPEDITENIIKFIIINKEHDSSCIWSSKGDLLSEKFGVIECKSFTSDGPLSFTPTSDWNVIYFLDAKNWLKETFVLYKINLKRTSEKWKKIMVNKTQTFNDQCLQGRRPRLNWKNIHSQLGSECEQIFEGTFESIFTSDKKKE